MYLISADPSYFIESSAIILANSDIKYTETLWNNYNNIRSPYAKSVACVIIGDKFLKDSEEFLYNEFLSFKQKYPFETYHEAPLFMIYTINDEY